MRKRFVIANWKMHPESAVEARKLFSSVKKGLTKVRKTKVVMCPPALYLDEIAKSYKGSSVMFGAQDVSQKEKGSYTGELSAKMLRRSGAEFVIVGHSERRALGETNKTVAEKAKAAISSGLSVVVCVGESSRDDEGEYLKFIGQEITESLSSISPARAGKLLIAYEPIWAIGKSAKEAMTMSDIHQMHIFIKKVLSKIYGRKIALSIPILYGGSVEPSNAGVLILDTDSAGFLVGHASLVSKDFIEIVKEVEGVK